MTAVAIHVDPKGATMCAVNGANHDHAVFSRCGDPDLEGISLAASVARQVAARMKMTPPFTDADVVWLYVPTHRVSQRVAWMQGAVAAAMPSSVSVALKGVPPPYETPDDLSEPEMIAYSLCREMLDA